MTREISAAARELDANCREHDEHGDLREKEKRIRQQPGLPVIHGRQKRPDAGDDEKLANHSQREQGQQSPEDCRARHRHMIGALGALGAMGAMGA